MRNLTIDVLTNQIDVAEYIWPGIVSLLALLSAIIWIKSFSPEVSQIVFI